MVFFMKLKFRFILLKLIFQQLYANKMRQQQLNAAAVAAAANPDSVPGQLHQQQLPINQLTLPEG